MSEVPSAAQYTRFLRAMKAVGALTETYEKLLVAHYHGEDHTLTTRQLADAMGWPMHSSVNVHYGSLGQKLADRMGWKKAEGDPEAASVASFHGGSVEDPGTRWVMHPKLATALKDAGIV